ncbi:MAG TPA: VCBS repeat-containing protein, partial [Candidatus Kapabacteria bacterium]|nr:VCBS repeat-containing protein [Candidatus Kapabacteria bacterium]
EYITTYPSYSIGLHDFNGDGRLDICSFNGFNNTITWRENLGGGNFGVSRVIDDDYLYKNFVLDIDGDGSLDIVSMSSQTWKLSLNDGSGNFNTFPINITLDLFIIEKFLAADMDGLPGSELLVSASQSNELIWHYPVATEPNPPRYITAPAISQVTSVNLSDVNNNGTPDVLLTSSMNSTICYYSYLEDSTFAAQQTIANTYGRPLTLLPIDMDIDGDIDILACFDGQNGIAWLENDGLDNYQTLHPIASYTQTRYFEHVDLNGDGLKDIVFGKSSYWGEPQSLVWLKNLGTGYANMQHITILSLPEHAYSLSDINNDGLIDIIAYIGTELAIQWHRNLGAGIFATRQTLLAAVEPQNTMQFADIDGNNTKDMVIANFNNLTVSWYSNDGIGNFSSPNSILIESTGNTTLFDCKVIDLDNDNYPDIVLGKKWGFVNNPVTWFRNQHNSTFAAEQTIIPFAENTTLMFFADIDNDQDWDIILAHNGHSNNCKVSWHQNLLETIVNIPTLPTPFTP